ncbi:MAG: YggT family protein [Dehalococcoidales bacterium]|nr:YggT family protein [Dehalococcoidales bacterium]
MIEIVAQLVNYTLSFLFWVLIGRLILALLIGERRNFVMDLMRRATDPVLYLVRRLLPTCVADRYIPWLSLPLLMALRLTLLPLFRL